MREVLQHRYGNSSILAYETLCWQRRESERRTVRPPLSRDLKLRFRVAAVYSYNDKDVHYDLLGPFTIR
jgi:hypothetical protein